MTSSSPGAVDDRLMRGWADVALLRQVLADHNCVKGPACTACGYVPTRRQPVCRSVVLAKAALRGRKPVWLGAELALSPKPSSTQSPDLFDLLNEMESTR